LQPSTVTSHWVVVAAQAQQYNDKILASGSPHKCYQAGRSPDAQPLTGTVCLAANGLHELIKSQVAAVAAAAAAAAAAACSRLQ
jgi:hypothetical protein